MDEHTHNIKLTLKSIILQPKVSEHVSPEITERTLSNLELITKTTLGNILGRTALSGSLLTEFNGL